MKEDRHVFRGGIRQRILILLLITIVLIITAYSAIFLYQTVLVEQMVNDTYEAQKQVYIDNGIEDQYEVFRTRTIDVFHREMFHARNILMLTVVLIVATGMATPVGAFGLAITMPPFSFVNCTKRAISSVVIWRALTFRASAFISSLLVELMA